MRIDSDLTSEFNGPATATVMMGGVFTNPIMSMLRYNNTITSFLFSIINETKYVKHKERKNYYDSMSC